MWYVISMLDDSVMGVHESYYDALSQSCTEETPSMVDWRDVE